jgi:2-keto-4-pentenoate hydratase/2-oxohepta-3-ene-1,7-dioic acid hydratase in catechol pathway
MRLTSFIADERQTYGIVNDSGIVDCGARFGAGSSLCQMMQAGRLDELAAYAHAPADFGVEDVSFLPVIPDPAARFFCIGINYRPHMLEMGRSPPERPVVFVRFASSLVGHRQQMLRPRESEKYDFEGELAVVIGRPGRRIPHASALDHVAGFACLNDGSVRDYQRHTSQFTPGKNFDKSGAFGPWMVTRDSLSDPARLQLTTRLNGSVVQNESTGELLFGTEQLIEYISAWTELKPGDVISTGTPGGVGAGREPPLWMKRGDQVEVEISEIGVLTNTIADDDDT